MREQIKSGLLFLLVLCSLFLTQQLWFGRPPAEMIPENGYEPVYFEEPRQLSGMIVPEGIYLYIRGQCYRILTGAPEFSHFWQEISAMLQDLAEPGYYYYTEELPREAERCLVLQFEPFLPLGQESIWLKGGRSGELSGMELWRLGDRCWARLEIGAADPSVLLLPSGWSAKLAHFQDHFVPAKEQLCEQLPAGELALPRGNRVILNAPVYVPVGVSSLERLGLTPEQLDRELLLKTFFINRNLVREIKERDGGLIYTDGEQGLRLGRGLDYSHPRLEQKNAGLGYSEALLTAGKLISYHGGWVKNLRLQSLLREDQEEHAGEFYRARWCSYLDGYPLLGDCGVVMRYHHGGLQSYRRNLFEPLDERGEAVAVAEFRKALEAAVMMLDRENMDGPLLEGMELAYYPEGEEAVPVWRIFLDGRELLLKTEELVAPEGWEP
ncbi:MAG: hypothetical protein GYA86_01400 [Firmicutes bacterium]|nr:hypothetical protein [Bacillota bacterium]